MRLISLLLLAAFFAITPRSAGADLTHMPVRALLVTASKQAGESDARLASYEPTLRRILRFESFRWVGEGSADLAKARDVTMDLGHGHTLGVRLESIAGRYSVNWEASGKQLISTRLALRPGIPAVLGGPATGKEGEVWAVILVAE